MPLLHSDPSVVCCLTEGASRLEGIEAQSGVWGFLFMFQCIIKDPWVWRSTEVRCVASIYIWTLWTHCWKTFFFGYGQVLNDMKHACSILVTSVPKNTKATLSLREPAEVSSLPTHQLLTVITSYFCTIIFFGNLVCNVAWIEGWAAIIRHAWGNNMLSIALLQVMEFLRRLVQWKKTGMDRCITAQSGRFLYN